MKVGLWEVDNEEKKDYLTQNLSDHQLFFFEEPLTEDYLPDQTDFEVISIFVGSQINSQVINHFPNLELITVRATGYDNVDLNAAKEHQVTVSNVPAYGSHTVAEYTFGLILSLSRHIPTAVNRLKIGFDFSFEGLRGFDLNGKTLGVIGTGKIGLNVVQIAKGFNMTVLAFDAYPNEKMAESLGFTYKPLEEVLKLSDIVTLHVPYLTETHHLINRTNIFFMKKGSLLINTARGPVIETEALFQALTQKHLAGAGLDVLEEEVEIKEEAELLAKGKMPQEDYKKVLQNHLLINLPQVIVTPHMAFYTKEAEESILETTVKNIKGLLTGKLEYVVKA